MNNRIKTALWSIAIPCFIVVITAAWAAGDRGYGCEIKQGIMVCGSKDARLEGCYQ